MSSVLTFAVFFVVTAGAALFGAQFMPGEWYARLAKPSWTPPNSVFSPVWTVLYIMIAVAGALVWRARRTDALTVWGVSLCLNAAWSWLFFGRQAIGLALVDIIMLLLSIAAFIGLAWTKTRAASLLFVPYLLWVGFATALNFAIWQLN